MPKDTEMTYASKQIHRIAWRKETAMKEAGHRLFIKSILPFFILCAGTEGVRPSL
jgi:hypothetical protein